VGQVEGKTSSGPGQGLGNRKTGSSHPNADADAGGDYPHAIEPGAFDNKATVAGDVHGETLNMAATVAKPAPKSPRSG